MPEIDRRGFLAAASTACLGALAGCRSAPSAPAEVRGPRLLSRPHAPTKTAPAGLQPLGLSSTSPDGRLFVPAGHTHDKPLPLIVLLHGVSGSSADWFGSYDDRGEAAKYLILAPDSRFYTWDVLWGEYSVDIEFLDRALEHVFDRCAVDPERIAIAGFSNGASYALGVGLANGDLFKSVIAYSPGRFIDGPRIDKPGIFMSHGTADTILPIDDNSRRHDSVLRALGYDVEFREFDGAHLVPQSISDAAFEWLKIQFA